MITIDNYKTKENDSERLEDLLNNHTSENFYIPRKPVLNGSYNMPDSLHGACFFYGNLVRIQIGKLITYTNPIIKKPGHKGKDLEKVLNHERHHEQNPQDSEAKTRQATNTETFEPHPMVSYSKAA